MHMAEEVQLGFHRFYLFQKRCTAVTYSIADTVKDAEWRTVRYQHVNPVGNLCVMLDFRKVAILHAHKLCFTHPVTGEDLRFETPFPKKFMELFGK